jgi:hypothetical protein
MKTPYRLKFTILIAVLGSPAAFSRAAWTALDDFSGSTPVVNYMAYDSDTVSNRDVVYGLTGGALKPINTIIRAGYAGGFWWTGGEVLRPGDSVKVNICVGAQNVCAGFRFSKSPFGKALSASDATSGGSGTIAHGEETVYADTCWVNVYQRTGQTQFQLNAGTGGTGQGNAVEDGTWLAAGTQPTTNDFFTLVVTRGTGGNQSVLTWGFEGGYFAGNSGVVPVPAITAGESLYFAMNLNGSSANGRFDNLAFQREPCSFFFALTAKRPVWSVTNCTHRLILQVPASSMMDARPLDERPAIVEIDFTNELSKAGFAKKKPDISTLQLIEFDPGRGAPVPFVKNAIQQTSADRPVRWYDEAVPFSFPDFAKDIHSTGGIFSYNALDRWGYFYETVGDWKKGRIGWVHTHRRDRPTWYAAYFNLMDEDGVPPSPEPRGMIGDGINRTEETGDTSTGQLKTTITLDDWNGDGLEDIITGCARGQIAWWPNFGTEDEPEFVYSRMLFMENGKPLDVGMQGVPAIADWDGDGKKDLIISSLYKGHLNFFKNVGSNTNRVFSYFGFLKADGADIESPSEPNPETLSAEGVQSILQDYYSVPVAVDWDNDGDLDLLTGGYVTGQINFYKNIGADTNGIPVLTSAGPIVLSNGLPLDVGWSASPAAADINNDGKLDLVSGLWSKAGLGGVIYQPGEGFLRYFEGVGTSSSNTPLLELKPLPRTGSFPALSLGSPVFGDFNNDHVLDLVVAAGMDIYLITNTGTASAPNFDAAHMKKILVKNGSASLSLQGQFQDLNGDGHPDMVDGTAYRMNTGAGYPFRFSARQSYLPAGTVIDHPVAQGDGWRFYLMADPDVNGTNDVLFGDFWGQIWFHRSLGASGFDTNGVLVVDTNGAPVHVPASLTPSNEWDFTTMQGSRIMFACADFSGDSRKDIITRDTDGNITLFEQTGSTNPLVIVMKSGVVISGNRGRGFVYDVDWNGDGWRDVYLPGSGTSDIILLNTGVSTNWTVEIFNRPGIPVVGTDTSAQPVDLNEDGDIDILVTSGYRFTSLFEKSFLEQGYAQGRIITLEQRSP